jgi:hypothetical protein
MHQNQQVKNWGSPRRPRSLILGVSTARHSEFGDIVSSTFTPVLANHSKSFNLIDTLALGVDRIRRNFEPMQRQVEHWRQTQLTDERAKLIFYVAFVDGKLEAARSLLSHVHRLYFEPQYEEFSPRTMWSLSNTFTSAFKKLDPARVCLTLDESIVFVRSILVRGNPIQSWRMILRSEL